MLIDTSNIRKFYIEKFSNILELTKDDSIVIDLEGGLFNYSNKFVKNINSNQFKKHYIKNSRRIVSNLTYTPNSKFVIHKIKDKLWPANIIAEMTHEDLYPELHKFLSLKKEKNMIKHIPIEEQPDGLIKCRFCKSMKTVYTQAQTRSADEPMTTFVTCLNCDKHFKF